MLTSYYALAIVMLGSRCFLLSIGKEAAKYVGKPEKSHKLSLHSQEGNRNRRPNSNHEFTWIQGRGNFGLS